MMMLSDASSGFFCVNNCNLDSSNVFFENGDTTCKDVIINKYYRTTRDSIAETGIIIRGKLIECEIEFDNNLYKILFGRPQSNARYLVTYCYEVEQENIFNNMRDGKKTGIWLKWNLWNKIKSATEYRSGKKLRVVYFRSNGRVLKTLRFNNSGQPIYESYNEDGYKIGNPGFR